MKFLSYRDRQPEMMDQPGLNTKAHRRALYGLKTTNLISRTSNVIWRSIKDAKVVYSVGRPLRILDIAAGGGDVLIRLAKLACRNGVELDAFGCDISSTAVHYAQHAAAQSSLPRIQFFQFDALADTLPDTYDVVLCTLFLHHLSDHDARHLLKRMSFAATQCVLVDDLRRTWMGYLYAWVGGRLISRSDVVHTDGPLSVRAAFTITEARTLASAAGLHGAKFQRHWPERFLMSWKKDAE